MSITMNKLALMITALLLASSAISAIAKPDESAFIVAHKKAVITQLRNGAQRVSVSIDVYNQGSVKVYDVSLVDDSWPSESFDVISGNFSRTWESLDAGAIISHSFELEPKLKGQFLGAPAVITFRIPTKAAPVVSYSTPLFPMEMLADIKSEDKLELAKGLVARFGPQVSAVSLVALFGYMLVTPSKSNAAKTNKKRR